MKVATIADLKTLSKTDKDEVRSVIGTLSTKYEDYIQNKNEYRPNPHGIHASEFHGCLRKPVYSLLAVERRNKIANTWKKRFNVGHALHHMLQEEFKGMVANKELHMTFEEEVAIEPKLQPLASSWDIFSHCDGIFTLREAGVTDPFLRVLLEIKTEAPDSYSKLTAPKESHIWQAHIYMACLDIPFTWFLYWNKGNQNYTSPDSKFLIEFDPVLWEKLEKRLAQVHDLANNMQLPEREESMLCEFCSFSYVCEPTYLNRVGRSHELHTLRRR